MQQSLPRMYSSPLLFCNSTLLKGSQPLELVQATLRLSSSPFFIIMWRMLSCRLTNLNIFFKVILSLPHKWNSDCWCFWYWHSSYKDRGFQDFCQCRGLGAEFCHFSCSVQSNELQRPFHCLGQDPGWLWLTSQSFWTSLQMSVSSANSLHQAISNNRECLLLLYQPNPIIPVPMMSLYLLTVLSTIASVLPLCALQSFQSFLNSCPQFPCWWRRC